MSDMRMASRRVGKSENETANFEALCTAMGLKLYFCTVFAVYRSSCCIIRISGSCLRGGKEGREQEWRRAAETIQQSVGVRVCMLISPALWVACVQTYQSLGINPPM